MAFSTWSELLVKMRDDYASGNWRTKSYDFDGVRKEFVSPDEFFKVLRQIENRAAAEQAEDTGGVTYRTSARASNR
jgi:hypothetical protein